MRWILVIGALFAFLSVALGAFAAHGLKSILEPRLLDAFKTGVQYQMYHALGLILIALVSCKVRHKLLNWSAGFMVTGVVLFSGSLYALALTGIKWFGPITPLGGTFFLLAWVLLILVVIRSGQWQE